MRNRFARLLLVVVLVSAAAGCATSDTIVELPPPKDLPDLAKIEQHLDYEDPDDGKLNYIPRRAQ